MEKIIFAVKDCNALLNASVGVVATVAEKAQFLCLLEANGFKLKSDALDEFFKRVVSVPTLVENLQAIKTIVGSHVAHNVLISNFPSTRGEDYFTKIIAQFVNILTDGGALQEDVSIIPFKEDVKYKELSFVDNVDEEILKVFHSKVPLKLDNEKLLAELYKTKDPVLKLVDPKQITLKEVLARHVAYNLIHTGVNGFARNAVDVLRAIAIINNEPDAKLDRKFKIASMPNVLRVRVIKELNPIIKIDDVTGHKEMFKHLFKSLHVHDKKYKGFNENVSEVAKLLQTINNPKTEKTLIHSALSEPFNEDNKVEKLNVLVKNPSFFARGLDNLLRNNKEYQKDILNSFLNVSDKLNTTMVLQMLGHFGNRNKDITTRAFTLKGISGGVKVVNDKPLEAMDSNLLSSIDSTLLKVLRDNFVNRETFIENAVIDKSLYKINIPLGLSSSDGLKTVSRGSKLDIEFKDILRLFVHWKASVDLDLSALFLDENLKTIDRCAYYNLHTGKGTNYAIHSGDVRSAPQGGSEFVDIHIDKLPKKVRYIVMHVNSYSGQSCEDIPELFAGYMNRENESGKIYEPKTVEDKFTLTGSIASITPFYIDLVNKEMVWCDDKGSNGAGRGVDDLVSLQRLFDVTNKKVITIGELLELHSENVITTDVYELLSDEEKSQYKVFDKEFAFDIKEITSAYL